jgi:hypothetical protein
MEQFDCLRLVWRELHVANHFSHTIEVVVAQCCRVKRAFVRKPV